MKAATKRVHPKTDGVDLFVDMGLRPEAGGLIVGARSGSKRSVGGEVKNRKGSESQ